MENSMQAQSSSSEQTPGEAVEKKKPGPAAKPKVEMAQIEELQDALVETNKLIKNLQGLVVRMAHNTGVAHELIKRAGLEPYNPTKSDMTKFRG